MNPTFDITIANFLECHRRELLFKLEDALVRAKVVRHFEDRRLITTYKNKDGNYKEFNLRDISLKGADEQYAYNGYMSITVRQHYFVRHDIALRYPANPCAIEITGKANQHYNYFPLETVRLAPAASTTTSKARRYISKLLQRPFQSSKEHKAHRSQIAHRVNNMMKRHYAQKRIYDKLISSNPSTDNNDELIDPLVSLFDKLAISDNENEHHYETLSLGTTTTDDDSDLEYGPPPDTIIYMDEVDLPSCTRKPPSEMEVSE